jgi:hypothetical protein
LTELTDTEGSDNEMRDSEEDAGQERSRTVKSEVVNNCGYNCEYLNKSRSNSEPTINYCRGKPNTRHLVSRSGYGLIDGKVYLLPYVK